MQRLVLWSAALTLLVVGYGDTARILALFPIPGHSHFIAFQNYLEALARRGHKLTVISAFPRTTPLENYIDIPYEDYLGNANESQRINVFQKQDLHPVIFMLIMRQKTIEMCEHFLEFPNIRKFIDNKDLEFDIIIYEPFFMECTYGILNKFRVPTIHISSNTITKWMGDGVGNPYIYSYMPEVLFGYSTHMSFLQRLVNAVTCFIFDFQRNFLVFPKMHQVAKRAFNDPNIPDLRLIETNASLLLLNSHVSLNYPRPFTPNTIEVGGMHIKPVQKLPQKLQELLDGSKNGVIYFSLGTNVRGSDMPENILQAFVTGFSRIKETVLWKFDLDSIPNLSKNVHLGKWFPQNDVLAHKNMKVFITHGGMLSTQEATYRGLPLIALPLMADQKQNARKATDQGYAIYLDFQNLTSNSLVWAINEVTTNVRYQEKAKHLSKLFQDQIDNPLDRAVYWTEFVIRHNGARHMQSASVNLSYIEYLLLDVIAVILLVCLTSCWLLFMMCRVLRRRFSSKEKLKSRKEKKKTN